MATNNTIIPMDDADDKDSAIGDDFMSDDTATLASSIYHYRIENGRYETSPQTMPCCRVSSAWPLSELRVARAESTP
jgi:hypothetical protein